MPDKSWYLISNRGAQRGWFNSQTGSWYFFDTNGKMKTGWLITNSGSWYYFNEGGQMKIGWVKIGSYYYYFDSSGVMQTNKTIDGYYVDSNGRRIKK